VGFVTTWTAFWTKSKTNMVGPSQQPHGIGKFVRSFNQTINEITVPGGTTTQRVGVSPVAVGANIGDGQVHARGTAVGVSTIADADGSVALGADAESTAADTIAIGDTALGTASDALSIGDASIANSQQAIALGADATTSGDGCIGLGYQADGGGTRGIGIGYQTFGAPNAVAIGEQAGVGSSGVAIGQFAFGFGGSEVCIGPSASAGGSNAVALGSSASASSSGEIAIGPSAGLGVANAAHVAADQLVFGGTRDTASDADLSNGEMTVEIDEANSAFRLRGKDSTGTVREATVPW